jgi:hypothetical protein
MPYDSLVGYIAAALVFATFCTKRIVPLRSLAIASNLVFLLYGSLNHLWPIVVLHAAMLPVNALRLREARAAAYADAASQPQPVRAPRRGAAMPRRCTARTPPARRDMFRDGRGAWPTLRQICDRRLH